MLRPACIGPAIVLGLAAAANGGFMLMSPQAWYFAVPDVTTTGRSTSTSSATSA